MRLVILTAILLVGCVDEEPKDTGTGDTDEACAGVEVSETALAWEGVRLGVSTSTSVVLTNPCDELVVVDGSIEDDAAFSLPDDSYTLAAGASEMVTVSFEVSDADTHEGTLIFSTHGGEELPVALSGWAETDWDGDGWEDVLAGGDDCDDGDAYVNPAAAEVCNGIDDDCDGATDDVPVDVYLDADGDGWGAGAPVVADCEPPPGYVLVDGDCDDSEATVYPGATEVSCDGIDQDCDGSLGDAAMSGGAEYATIQDAIDAATAGDTVEVCPGTWTESLSITKDLVLTSYSGDPSDTILDGEDSRRILEFYADDVTISHLTFFQGADWIPSPHGTAGGGGGCVTGGATELLVEGCVFQECRAGYSGGGVGIRQSDGEVAEFVDCTFLDNLTDYEGGALAVKHDTGAMLTLTDSTFTGNHSGYEGGGLSWDGWEPSTLVVEDCTFDSNTSDNEGGGMALGSWAEGDDVTITDTTFVSNSGRTGAGITLGTWGWAQLAVSDSSFSGNTATDGAAVSLESWATWVDVSFDDTTFDANTATSGTAVFTVGSRIESCAVVYDGCTISSNTSGSRYGAVYLPSTCDLESIDTDWGTGSTDNSPYDLCAVSGCDASLGASESFVCTGGKC